MNKRLGPLFRAPPQLPHTEGRLGARRRPKRRRVKSPTAPSSVPRRGARRGPRPRSTAPSRRPRFHKGRGAGARPPAPARATPPAIVGCDRLPIGARLPGPREAPCAAFRRCLRPWTLPCYRGTTRRRCRAQRSDHFFAHRRRVPMMVVGHGRACAPSGGGQSRRFRRAK